MQEILISVFQEREITRFVCTGKASSDGYREIVECIESTMAEPRRGRKVLLDLTGMDGELPEFEKFTLAEYAAVRLAGLRIGALMNPKTPITRFGENTAVNRGVDVLASHEEEELYGWLVSPSRKSLHIRALLPFFF